MENLSLEIKESLEKIAYKYSIPFCYGCYREAPAGVCQGCHSDDLMRLVHGVGVEFGIDWVIKHLVSENVESANTSETFEQSVRGCYDESVKIGWIEYDLIDAVKKLDPVSYEMAESEWIDTEISDGNLATFDNGNLYYWMHDIESFISEMNKGMEAV